MGQDVMVRIATILIQKQGGVVRIPREDLYDLMDSKTVLEISEDREVGEVIIRVKEKP